MEKSSRFFIITLVKIKSRQILHLLFITSFFVFHLERQKQKILRKIWFGRFIDKYFINREKFRDLIGITYN